LFKHRTSLPLPIAAALLLIPPSTLSPTWAWLGAMLVAAGELLRLWAVRHIGVISRTRSERLGPLVSSGPFGRIRNPLYVGNVAIWTGFALVARIPWLAPIVAAALAVEYHVIVLWEEALLSSRIGAEYRTYTSNVPRWIPRSDRQRAPNQQSAISNQQFFSWRDTLFSERGTLIAIAAGFALLWLKVRF
jgi:protein-S-isoprenylcysteine O-methyltransferase Ste14